MIACGSAPLSARSNRWPGSYAVAVALAVSGRPSEATAGQKRPLISWQSTAEKALWKQLLTRSPIFGGMDALLISHKHSFLLALATCCEARAYAAFGYNWLIPRSI